MARTAGFRILRVQTERPGLGGSRTAALLYKGVLLGYTLRALAPLRGGFD